MFTNTWFHIPGYRIVIEILDPRNVLCFENQVQPLVIMVNQNFGRATARSSPPVRRHWISMELKIYGVEIFSAQNTADLNH